MNEVTKQSTTEAESKPVAQPATSPALNRPSTVERNHRTSTTTTTRPTPQLPETESDTTFPTKEIIGTHFITRLPISPKFTTLHASHVVNDTTDFPMSPKFTSLHANNVINTTLKDKHTYVSLTLFLTNAGVLYGLCLFCGFISFILFRKIRHTRDFLMKRISILNTFSAKPIVRNASVRSTDSYLLAFNRDYEEVTNL